MSPEGRVANLTVEDWLLVHLLRYARYQGEFEVPWAITQYGIAEAVGTGQDHVSRAVRRLVQRGVLTEAKSRVEGVQEKRKVYFLTAEGQAAASELARKSESIMVRLADGTVERTVPLKEAAALLGKYTMIEVARALRPDGMLDRQALGAGRRADEAEPALPVAVPAHFVGRASELETLRKWLVERRIIVILGIPGIGKTALAARLVSEARAGRPVFWYRFHEWDTPRNLLAPLAEFLAQQGRRKLKLHLASKPDIDFTDICYLLVESFRGQKAILVLDDVHKASGAFLPCLSLFAEMPAQAEGIRVVITARSPPAFYDRRDVMVRGAVGEMRLEGLDEESSRQLLRAHNVDAAHHGSAFRITGGHPLALELFVPGAEEAEERGNIARYIEEEIGARLSGPERKLLRMASVYRYPVPAEALFWDEELTYDVLSGLVARSLLREPAGGKFDIHDFLREFFYSRMTPRERAALHREAARFYSRADGSRSRLELIHHLLKAGDHARAAESVIQNGEALLSAGCVEELKEAMELLDPGAMGAGARGELTLLKARSSDILGDWDLALELYAKALSSGEEGRKAESYYRIGWIQQKRNLWREAAESFRRCLSISKARADPRGLARAHHGLGRVLWRQGKLSEAARLLRQSIENALAANDPSLEASACIELGRVLAATGKYAEAERSLRRSLELFDKMGDLSETARAYNTLGWEVLRPQGRLDLALETIYKGEELALSQGNLRELAPIYHSLGEVWARKGFSEKADEFFAKSLELFRKQGDEHGAAYNHLGMAITSRARGQFARAQEDFERAVGLFEKVGTPADLAYALGEFGEMWRQKGEPAKARALLDKAKRITRGLRGMGNGSRAGKKKA